MDNLNSQSQNYQGIMSIVRGRKNQPQYGKLRTNVLLFLLWVLQLRYHVRKPWPLCHTGSCYVLCCLFFLILIFFGSSASVCTRVWKPHLLQYEMVPVSCWVSRSTEQMFWWVSESVLRRSKGSSSSTVSDKEEVRNCSEGCSSIDQPPAFPITLPVRWILTSCS